MAGENAAYLHAPPGFAPRPLQTGWFADFAAMEGKQAGVGYSKDGGRFFGATFDPTGVYRYNAICSTLARERLDTTAISARCEALREAMIQRITAGDAGKTLQSAELLQPNAGGPQARFVSLRHAKATEWKAKLMAQNVITDARDDILRIGFGLYQDADDVDAFCAAAAKILT
jgi:selenocysteine lyase/cysteine desulfurase